MSILFSCKGQMQIAKKISRNIWKENVSFSQSKKAKKNEKLAFKYRNELLKKGVLDFISVEKKLYILEGYDFETDIVYVTIWNKKDSISFSYNDKGLKLSDEVFISQKLKGLLSVWNLEAVKSYAKGERAITGGLDMYITCYITNRTGNIEKVIRDSFQQFDDLDW